LIEPTKRSSPRVSQTRTLPNMPEIHCCLLPSLPLVGLPFSPVETQFSHLQETTPANGCAVAAVGSTTNALEPASTRLSGRREAGRSAGLA
ncbi:hypothetical protein CI238_06677, partial [Colletotrichum incanum]